MNTFEKEIICGLKPIDENSANMTRPEIEQIINNLLELAQKEKSEVWEIFLNSERAYYNGEYQRALNLTLKAHELDKENAEKNGEIINYYILSSLAVSYYMLEKFELAEKCYLKAIELNPEYYQNYIDLTTMYRCMGRFDEAAEKINVVLKKVNEGEMYYQAIESKGRLLLEMHEYEQANKLLLSIIENKKLDAEYLDAVALSYFYIKDYEQAKKYYSDALKYCKDKALESHIKIKLESLKIFNENEGVNNTSEELLLNLPKEKSDLIEKLYSSMLNRHSLIEKYHQKYNDEEMKRTYEHKENYLICLKGWSSSTPELSLGISEEKFRYGGGFYLRYKEIGIVIDPGLNFFENFHDNHLFVQDIDVVIVTHNHIDHNNDLGKILDMDYQINKQIYYYLDKETYSKFCSDLENVEKKSDNLVNKIFPDAKKKEKTIKIPGKGEIKLLFCQTEHNCDGSFGFKIILDNTIIGYTSDTRYTDQIGDFFKDSDIIIANISETNKGDILLTELKKTHLGIYGVYNILKNIVKSNALCLLTEFYGGFGDIRLEMADVIKEYLKDSYIDIVPVDIGMMCFIDDKTFSCNSCKGKADKYKRSIVRMGKLNKTLYCLCGNCSYKRFE